ncbi:threonine synthase [Anaerolinea sp.]
MKPVLICGQCKTKFPLDFPIWKCNCGGMLDISMELTDKNQWKTSKLPGLWRYLPLIPLPDNECIVTLGEGLTPITHFSDKNYDILIKQEQLFPTGSYKDRGAAVMVSAIKALGIDSVVEDSSGNAGCAIAAYCARAKVECSIYVPSSTSPAKLMQIASYGARIVKVDGTREDTARAAWEAAQTAYYASHSWNPFFFQGTKTFAYEIWEQTEGNVPDVIILPVGNGTLFLGAYFGFWELLSMGLIQKIPRLVGVQASRCAPLFHWDEHMVSEEIIKGPTIAEGIAIVKPVRGKQILEAVHETNGLIITVEEEEIVGALQIAVNHGFFVEPTGIVGLAGALRYFREYGQSETVLTAFTGHGLKSPEKIQSLLDHGLVL